jgi:hypothetical protein
MQEEAGDTPSVWEGIIIMPDVTKFKVRSYQVDSVLKKFLFIPMLRCLALPTTSGMT